MVRAAPPVRAAANAVEPRILEIFKEELEIDVGPDTALIDEGVLDSVAFVRLLAELERVFGVRLEIAELDLGDFHSVSQIARLVESRREVVG